MTIDQHDVGHKQHRTANADFLLRRAARELVGPVRSKLGPWQARAVHLVAIGKRLRKHGRLVPSYAAEAEALSVAVAYEQELLEERIAETPEAVAAHGELDDAQRALRSVAEVLAEARSLLKSGQAPALF